MKLGTINNFKYEKLKEYGISGVRLYIGNKNFLNDELIIQIIWIGHLIGQYIFFILNFFNKFQNFFFNTM